MTNTADTRSEVDSTSARPDLAAWTEDPYVLAEQDEIARLAYSFWEARGCQGGSPLEDWLRAEQELKARR